MDKQQLWDAFLARWPREELHNLTLEQYVAIKDPDTGENDTFIYWLETETIDLGSIQGNTAIKFGIYKRQGVAKKQKNIIDGEVYSWKSSYGSSEERAFSRVLSLVIEIAELAYKGDLEAIERIDLFPLVKWKIAFMYQNQQSPSLINVFSKSLLDALKDSGSKFHYPAVYKQLIEEKGTSSLLDYGTTCWEKAGVIVEQLKNEKIIEHFLHKPSFQTNYGGWPQHVIDAFCDIIHLAHKEGLDVFTTNMDTGSFIRLGRKEKNEEKAKSVFATFEPLKSKINYDQRYNYREKNLSLSVTSELAERIKKSKHLKQFKEDYPIERRALWPADYQGYTTTESQPSLPINETKKDYVLKSISPLNQIFYGPPGTGKTYHTIEAAVQAADPVYYSKLNIQYSDSTSTEFRTALTVKYKELAAANRIRFVTFHQSYGYEEFVEGLKATSDEGKIRYNVADGVFKVICDAAKGDKYKKLLRDNPKPKVWKLSIEWAGESEVCDDCFENDIARIGWTDTGDLNKPDALTETNKAYIESLGKNDRSSVTEFSQHTNVGDLVLVLSSKTTVKAVGVVTGNYTFDPEGHSSLKYYRHVLPVKWLVKNVNLPIVDLNDGVTLTQKTFYHLWRIKPYDVFNLIKEHHFVLPEQKTTKNQNYVLIIDEINRGNISKIFGELITLIEPSKRTGRDQTESLEVTLPVSGGKFSVPDNLYLIGTMNTADRSLAMMDTALRRRFDFIEMMPDYTVLKGAVIKLEDVEIDLAKLLETMNRRIEVLYDREHTLGHAFLITVKQLIDKNQYQEAFTELVSVFKNKIIPLLEEYFYEDWNKIRLVLGDNNKKDNSLIFITKSKTSFEEVFGAEHGLESYEQEKLTYQLADFKPTDGEVSVWSEPKAYVAIYDIDQVKANSTTQTTDEEL